MEKITRIQILEMFSGNPEPPFRIQYTALGYKFYFYEKVSSTNDVAKEIARSGEEKAVVIADMQTGGKGRLGRRWISPLGGLYFSIILRPEINPKDALKLTIVTSSAVAKTLIEMFDLNAEVRWPNDVFVNDRKICGILTETMTRGECVEFMVVGIGINANLDLEELPGSLQNTATSLRHECGHNIICMDLIENVLQSFQQRYTRFCRGFWVSLLQEWKKLAGFLGKQVEVTYSREVLAGEAQDVDDDGALILRLGDGTLKKIVSGDLKLRVRS